jgi:hypothetical protein
VNTDRLIDVLSPNLEPVRRDHFERTMILAIVTGGAAGFGLMLVTVALRPELCSKVHLD